MSSHPHLHLPTSSRHQLQRLHQRRSQRRPQPHPDTLAGSDTSTLASISAWTYDACTNASAYTSADVSTDSSTNAGHLTTTHQRIH